MYFDTYAFVEVIRGNPKYAKFKSTQMATSKLNLMELYYWVLKNFGKPAADKIYDETSAYALEIPDEIIKKAMVFRLEHKTKGLSYVDCIGYVFAALNGMKFLTGERQFKNMANVEFVQ